MATIQEAAGIITRWADPHGDSFGVSADVSYSFEISFFGGIFGDSEFDPDMQEAALLGLKAWADVAQINFFVDDDDPEINFANYDDDDAASYAHVENGGPGQYNPDTTLTLGYNLDKRPAAGYDFTVGLFDFSVMIHELGHAIGLAHPGDYNAGDEDDPQATYENDRAYREDSLQYTVMSYFAAENTGAAFFGYDPRTPLLHDIAAAQVFYGANMTTRTDNTTYGFNSTAGAFYSLVGTQGAVFCIWDAGGIDTLDVSQYGHDQIINLTPGSFSSTGGMTFNISMADAVDVTGNNRWEAGFNANAIANYVENAYSGTGNDTITGNAANNEINGGLGADTIDGGAGIDTALYTASIGEVLEITDEGEPALGRWLVSGRGHGTGDRLSGIERLAFGAGNDNITVRNGPGNIDRTITVDGGLGNDTLTGSGGSSDVDVLIGGRGSDVISPLAGVFHVFGGMAGSAVGTWIESADDQDLLTIWRRSLTTDYSLSFSPSVGALGGYTGSDGSTARGVARITYLGGSASDQVQGGHGNDSLFGNAGNDRLNGGAGNDELFGGDGYNNLNGGDGNDSVFGGSGDDWVLAGNNGDDLIETGGGGDAAYGEAGNDTLVSGGDAEQLFGGIGDDTLFGGGGNDDLRGENGNDSISGGDGDDYISTGYGVETIDGGAGINFLDVYRYEMTQGVSFYLNGEVGSDGTRTQNITAMNYYAGFGNDIVVGGAGNDRINGNAGNDRIEGGGGYDNLNGGDGNDTVIGGAGRDWVLAGNNGDDRIETGGGGDAAYGEAGNDTLVSGNDGDLLFGGLDNDVLEGNGGDDDLRGEHGNDRLEDGAGNDRLSGGDGNDTMVGAAGSDTYDGGADIDRLILSGTRADWSFAGTAAALSGQSVALASGLKTVLNTEFVEFDDGLFTSADLLNTANQPPLITSNGGGSTAAISLAEGTTAVTTVTATSADAGATRTFSLAGGADAARFAINATTGALSFLAAPNFEIPADTGANYIYDVVVQVSDGTLTDRQALAITVTDVNEAPAITSNGGGATAAISVAENVRAVTTVIATDPDAGATRIFSITGGADAARFAINATTGALSFVTAPNFESPADAGADNVHDVIVQVSDGTLTDSQTLTVTVTDSLRGVTILGTDGNDVVSPAVTVAGQPLPTDEADELRGLAGNDVLDGGLGADTLIGGAGDDIYVVNTAGDRVIETTTPTGTIDAGGIDTVRSTVSFSLDASAGLRFVERLTLGGSGALTGTGNALANILTGNSGASLLAGGLGNDTYVIRSSATLIDEGAGGGLADRVATSVDFTLAADDQIEALSTSFFAGTTAINLTGNALAQSITGNAGANRLSDGGGAGDTLTGGLGNDTYILRSAASLIVEGAGGGTDSVAAGVSFALAADDSIEVLSTTAWTGTASINLTGNALAQRIVGNAGANRLEDGAGAADTLAGGAGNDTYVLRHAGTRIDEAAGEGTLDVLLASVSYALAADDGIERMQTTFTGGLAALNLTGNALAQTIIGNAGANRIDGKGGNDILTGGGGADAFVFTTAPGAGNVDRITDYDSALDRIEIDDAVFLGLATGALATTAYTANTTGLATSSAHRLIYESDTGFIWFDQDGTGTVHAARHVATLDTRPAILGAGEFLVI